MSTVGTASLNSSISWRQRDTSLQSTTSHQSKINISVTLPSGTGSSEVNKAYFVSSTLSSGGILPVDLFSLTQDGYLSNVNLSGGYVKTILVSNPSEIAATGNSGYRFTLKATGVGGLISPFGSGYLSSPIYPQSYQLFSEPATGYPVGTVSRYFYLHDGGSGASYELAIFGVL